MSIERLSELFLHQFQTIPFIKVLSCKTIKYAFAHASSDIPRGEDASLNWKKMAGTLRGDLVRAAPRVDRRTPKPMSFSVKQDSVHSSLSDTIHLKPFHRDAL